MIIHSFFLPESRKEVDSMASSKIKGITIEIGGNTTKLGKALEGVNKQFKDL